MSHYRSFLATGHAKPLLIMVLLGLSVTSLPILACQPGEVNCDCNVTKLEVEADPVGPDSPKKLNSIVQFNATTTWSSNTTIHMNVYVDRQLLASYTGNSNNNDNLTCGDVIQEVFQFVNKKLDNSSVSGYPIVEVVVFVGHPDNPRAGDLSCDHPLCKKFVVYYHFPPAPENVIISHTPRKVTRGDVLSVRCSTEDGYPRVQQLGIRALDNDNKQQLHVPLAELVINVSDSWSFQCEATNFPFGEMVVVQSKDKVKVLDETPDLLKRNKGASVEGSVEDGDQWDENTFNTIDTVKANNTIDTVNANNTIDTVKANNTIDTVNANNTIDTAKASNTTDTVETNTVKTNNTTDSLDTAKASNTMNTAKINNTTDTTDIDNTINTFSTISAGDTATFVVASSTEDKPRDILDRKTPARPNPKIKSRFTSRPRLARKTPPATSRSTSQPEATISSEKRNPVTSLKSVEDSVGQEDEGGMFDAQIDALSSYTAQIPSHKETQGKGAISEGMGRYPVLALELALMGVSLVICHLL